MQLLLLSFGVFIMAFVVVANADNIRFQTSTTIVIVQLNIWCSYSFNVNLKCYYIENLGV